MAILQSKRSAPSTRPQTSRESSARPKVIKPRSEEYYSQPDIDYAEVPLFRPSYPIDDIRCLPFVGEQVLPGGRGRSFWTCPPPEGYSNDCRRGKLFAAAWLIQQRQANGTGPQLPQICREMSSADRLQAGFAVGFLDLISRYALSAADTSSIPVERYVRTLAAEEVEYMKARYADGTIVD